MRLIFFYGLPATGKLTVAREVSRLTGYRLFHNHLVVDLLLSTFEFGSAAFVELRERMWMEVFEAACGAGVEGMVFTFNPEKTVRPGFAERVAELVDRQGGAVDFVELVCALEGLRARIDDASRRQQRKLASLELFDRLEAAGEFDTAHMPKARVTIDTGSVTAVDAAMRVCTELRLPLRG